MSKQTVAAEYTELNTRFVDFGITDDAGRAVGVRINTLGVTYTPSAEGFLSEPGFFYVANVLATRDGKAFGTSRPSSEFKTEAARDAFIAKRVSETRARYAKHFVKAA